MKSKSGKNKSIFQKLKRWLFVAVLAIILLVTAAFIVFVLNKDKISSRLLLSANNIIEGEIIFDGISLNPFVQFPSTSISLNNLKLYGNNSYLSDSSIMPLLDIEYLHAAINLRELVKGNIVVSNILAENGKINVVIFPDNSVNILNAIKRNDSITVKPVTKNSLDSDTVKAQGLALSLEGIGFENIDISITDKKTDKSSGFFINSLEANLGFSTDSLSVDLNTEIQIKELDALKLMPTGGVILKLDGKLNVNTLEKIVYLDYAKLDVNSALFALSGVTHFGIDKKVDISFKGSNTDMVFLSMLLNKSGLKNLKKGEIYINGEIKGSYNNRLPVTKCWFGIKNLELYIPETGKSIDSLNFNGYFNSGNRTDLSKAVLSIDTLTANLPNGYANGKLLLSNFKAPNLNYLFDVKTDLYGLEDVFNIKKIDNLSGSLTVQSRFNGKFSENKELLSKTKSYTSIIFDTVSFTAGNNIKNIEIDGQLSGNVDTLCINNLDALIGNSDFFINGKAYNLSTLIIPNQNDFTSHLNISSNLFDLTDFMNYRENVGIGFPYQAIGLYLDVDAQTNKKRMTESSPVPDITFSINQLDVTVNKMLPPVSLSNGTFVLGNNNGDLFLTFNNFDVETIGGKLKADVVYGEPFKSEKYVDIKSQITDFNPAQFFAHKKGNDTIATNALLNGSVNCKLLFDDKKDVKYGMVELNADELTYKTDSAEYIANGLTIKTDNVCYNTKVSKNPLVTLSTNMAISTASVITNKTKLDSLAFLINADNGGYNISSESIELFGEIGSGTLFVTPFAKPMVLKVDFDITQLDVSRLLKSFIKDTLVKGKTDLLFKLSGSGNNVKQVLASLNGEVLLTSNNLLLYGVDLDKLLIKVERSQHFNLVDLGAVLVAGPLGLLVSKGTTYTNILLTDRNSSTNITRFVSDWYIKNGVFAIRDVAFSTYENRIAAKGWLNIAADSLDVSIAVIDAKGCSKLSQSLSGSLKKPHMSELKIISSLIAPVTNLFEVKSNCEPFYTGSVKNPVVIEK